MELNTTRFRELFPRANIIHMVLVEVINSAGEGNGEVLIDDIPKFIIFQRLDPGAIITLMEELVEEKWLEKNPEGTTVKLTDKRNKLIWTDDSFNNYGDK